VTAADLAAGALVSLATAFLAWAVVRSDGSKTAVLLLLLAGSSIVAAQARSWMRPTRQPGRRLVACADGSLWLQTAGQVPCRSTLGVGTRLLGPSVFLDLVVDSNPPGKRLRTWLTPFDVPPLALRRWSVALPRCGRAVRQ
jgi:hypothetical protein